MPERRPTVIKDVRDLINDELRQRLPASSIYRLLLLDNPGKQYSIEITVRQGDEPIIIDVNDDHAEIYGPTPMTDDQSDTVVCPFSDPNFPDSCYQALINRFGLILAPTCSR